MRVLVADDESNTREALAEVLHEEGHVVTVASGGRAAVEHLGRSAFDLVITDLNMPDVDGVEVVELTRRMQPSAAVVVITAYGDRIRNGYRTSGDVVLLSKPFRLNEILAVVESVAAARRVASGSAVVAGGNRSGAVGFGAS